MQKEIGKFNEGGFIVLNDKGFIDGVITRVSKGEDREPAILPESGELRFAQLRPTSQKGDGRLPGIRKLE